MDANTYRFSDRFPAYRYADTGDGYTYSVADNNGNRCTVSYAAPVSCTNPNARADHPDCPGHGQNVLRRHNRR